MTTTENTTSEDLAARLAAAEAMIAKQQALDAARYGYQPPPAPQPSQHAVTMTEIAMQRVQERRRQAEKDAEAARAQAIRDAPKIAQHEQEVAAFDAEIRECHDQIAAIRVKLSELGLARQDIVHRYAMETNPVTPIERKVQSWDVAAHAMDRARRRPR